MIITRTPFRISLFGGGTDYPAWYKEHGGTVIATSINKYCYITARFLPPFFDFKYRLRYYINEQVKVIDEIKHPSIRECLKFLDIKEGVEIVHNADLPAQSGLGSSSTFSVGLLHALYALKNYMPTKRELALNAINVEQNMIKENVGSQDQTIAAFGGFNKIEFNGSKEIVVQPMIINKNKFKDLQRNLMFFFTGYARSADEIAGEQIKVIHKKKHELHHMMELVEEALKILKCNHTSLEELGKLLDEQWKIKRSMTEKISNNEIDEIYRLGKSAGATGGKLLGAGGGGFILFYAEPKYQEQIKEKLKKLLYVPFQFESTGSQIVYHSHGNNY